MAHIFNMLWIVIIFWLFIEIINSRINKKKMINLIGKSYIEND